MINRFIAKIISWMPEKFVWLFSQRYIAGKLLSDAVKISKSLNIKGVRVTLDVLGEYIKQKNEAVEYKYSYLKTLDAIKENGLNASISLKPTMFGLLIDKEFCYLQIKEVIVKAKENGVSVCLDMEDSTCTDIEITLFEKLYQEFPDTISFVLQAYLHRTFSDLERLQKINRADCPIRIRICKGIYIEAGNIAYQSKKEINDNYIKCLAYMMQNGFFCSIATHDKRLLKKAEELILINKLSAENYEFQMLYGVRPELGKSLTAKNYPLRVYVPYGTHWYGYSTRRLKENPRMISHIIKALIFRG
jgi:proline dehydrogenase